MGLDTSHGCWHGAYSAFMSWRVEIAKVAEIPLMLMEGFYPPGVGVNPFDQYSSMYPALAKRYTDALPIKWDILKPDPLHILLYHSDCDGEIEAKDCGPIADSLEALMPKLVGDFGGHIGDIRDKTQAFIDGLRLAAAAGEPVDFH